MAEIHKECTGEKLIYIFTTLLPANQEGLEIIVQQCSSTNKYQNKPMSSTVRFAEIGILRKKIRQLLLFTVADLECWHRVLKTRALHRRGHTKIRSAAHTAWRWRCVEQRHRKDFCLHIRAQMIPRPTGLTVSHALTSRANKVHNECSPPF